MVRETTRNVSVYFRMSSPYAPWAQSPEIHQADAPIESTPIFAMTPSARRSRTSRVTKTAYGIQSSGPSPANTSAVTFTLPMTWTTSAKSAAWRHPPRRSARISNASIHGSPAQGSSSTDSRPAYSSQ